MKYGFVKMGIITPKIEVGAPRTNIMEMLDVLNNVNSQFAVFPELSLTGSTCGDLFFQDDLIGEVIETLTYFLTVNPFDGITIIGAPVSYLDRLYNCAIVIKKAPWRYLRSQRRGNAVQFKGVARTFHHRGLCFFGLVGR